MTRGSPTAASPSTRSQPRSRLGRSLTPWLMSHRRGGCPERWYDRAFRVAFALACDAAGVLYPPGVKALPEDVETDALIGSLADGWGFDVEAIDYAAVGFGSYHWVATDSRGTRGFVTVDDLEQKPWLGDNRESAFEGLVRAFGTAVALRDAGLGFVVAPIVTSDGEAVRRIGARHTIALFPFVEGQAGRFGEYGTAEQRVAVVTMFAQLHQATSAVESIARRIDLHLAGRRHLESGLQEVSQTWSGGPFSEPAREALARHASDVAELLDLLDRLSRYVATRSSKWVVTHGEPHAVNLIRTNVNHMLVDWDTVAVAPPERDLWMLVGDTGDDATIYANATGHEPDRVAMDFFRLTWDLGDLAAYIHVLRSPHRRSDDTVKAFEGLKKCVATRYRWAALLA
jgi:spectinomycin phosphotransferase